MRGKLIPAALSLPLLARAAQSDVSNIGFDPRPGQALPEGARFIDQDRWTGVLGDLAHARPTVLALGY